MRDLNFLNSCVREISDHHNYLNSNGLYFSTLEEITPRNIMLGPPVSILLVRRHLGPLDLQVI
jgi:hypothetical protein